MSLIQGIFGHMACDTEDDSERLVSIYESATPDQQKVLDDAFTCLCGYALSSLIKMHPAEEDPTDEEVSGDSTTNGLNVVASVSWSCRACPL